MTYIKKLVMQGFKSFARRTEIPFDNSMNVIVGPNGSGKSNITDALCFVLGRLSIKSIRAAKAANLLFSGNKLYKGSNEAIVEVIFDNKDKSFSIDSEEVSIKRIVRKNGLSVYKINNETKTRQEILELLSQAGIDPNGFNIILQGEIQALVNSSAEDRRKIIEEVAGISIYETRKQKSLRELEKCEEKLKEVSSVLRERSAYLKNLEKERQEALAYQKLEETIKRCKATIISRNISEKEKEIWVCDKAIEGYVKEIEKIKRDIDERNRKIDEIDGKINALNKEIQLSTNNEQEAIYKEISDLKAEIAGLLVRKENFENRIVSSKNKQEDLSYKIEEINEEINKIQTQTPKIKEQQEIHKKLQEDFDFYEAQRRKFYVLKSELSALENSKSSKERLVLETKKELSMINQSIDSISSSLKYSSSFDQAEKLREELNKKLISSNELIREYRSKILELEKKNAALERDIKREEKLKEEINRLDFCPVCKQNVGPDHKHKVSLESDKNISSSNEEILKNNSEKEELKFKIENLEREIGALRAKIGEVEVEIVMLKGIEEKKESIKRLHKRLEETQEEIQALNSQIVKIREDFEKIKDSEQKYDEARVKLQEASFLDIDVDTEIKVKKRELNRLNVELKSVIRDIEDSSVELKKVLTLISEKEKILERKEEEERRIYEKSQKLFEEKSSLNDQKKAIETEIIGFQHMMRSLEEKINHNKIQKAQFKAQMDSLKSELLEMGSFELLSGSIESIKERLQKAQFQISRIGNVNLRALEIFDKVEEQVKQIQEKVNTIETEKQKVLKIIDEIDRKKRKSFIGTLESINQIFSRNFRQLSRKGEVFLEPENKKNPFDGGLNILVRVSRGRYFDVNSLSGGEKTLVALSLIFAIQEYRPYCFYIFDEIDAALDKHNSELLAGLIKKYMNTGQYIIITHNDTLISEAKNIYGVSMQENISKIVSLKV